MSIGAFSMGALVGLVSTKQKKHTMGLLLLAFAQSGFREGMKGDEVFKNTRLLNSMDEFFFVDTFFFSIL